MDTLDVFRALAMRVDRIAALGREAEMRCCLAIAERWSAVVDHARPLRLSTNATWIGGALLAATRSILWASLVYPVQIPDISDDELLGAGPREDEHQLDEWHGFMEAYVAVIMRAYQLRAADLSIERDVKSVTVTPIESIITLARVLYDMLANKLLEQSACVGWENELSKEVADHLLAETSFFNDEQAFLDKVYQFIKSDDVGGLLRYAASHRVDGGEFFELLELT